MTHGGYIKTTKHCFEVFLRGKKTPHLFEAVKRASKDQNPFFLA